MMMRTIEIKGLSDQYDVRRLSADDLELIYTFCGTNTRYYETCGREISRDLIEHDLTFLPPGIRAGQKYYLGFFENDTMVAVMDFIAAYPSDACIFIGFFMMRGEVHGKGIGTQIVLNALAHLGAAGFTKCQLAFDKDNPQSGYFWRKNGFHVINEISQDNGTLLLAEKEL